MDSHLAGQTLPENCWDNTRLIVQDSYLVKFLGKGAVEIRCPEGRWNGFSVETLVALISPHCKVTADHKDAFMPRFEANGFKLAMPLNTIQHRLSYVHCHLPLIGRPITGNLEK